MKMQTGRSNIYRFVFVSFVFAITCSCATGIPNIPSSGKGPVVILLSGSSGPDNHRTFASKLAALGYYAVLFDGNDFNPDPAAGRGSSVAINLRQAIMKAQRSPNALPGKVAVIGFSMGGGSALSHAATMPDLVSAIIAYYPMTMHVSDMRSLVEQIRVPVLVLAGELDTYKDCCPVESMRAMEASAKAGAKTFELVVYPQAYHGWSFGTVGYAADSWQRTIKMLSQYQPLR